MKTKLYLIILLALVIAFLNATETVEREIALISINVSGYVRNPGTLKLSHLDRLSDAIGLSMLSPDELFDVDGQSMSKLSPVPMLRTNNTMFPNYKAYQSIRNIKLYRGSEERTYDLFSFYRTGDLSQNPYLRDSDHVHVPLVEAFISVNGSVGYPGDMEYRKGDTVREALKMSLGPVPGSLLSAVRLSVYHPDTREYSYRTLDLIAQPELWDLELNPGDRIMVPYDSQYRDRITVTISGESMQHGEFNVKEGTTLWEMLQIAGGLSDYADLENAVVLNKSYNEEPDPEFERIKSRSMVELTPLEYAYLRIKLRQAKGRYSIDMQKLIDTEGKEGDIILNNDDHIYIPAKMNQIWVSGQVRYPGLIEFKEGEDWKYYVEKAGGYSTNRNVFGTRILRANSGNWIKASKYVELRPGDIVFIPDKQDRDFWSDFKDFIGAAASAVTIIIGIQNLSN